MLSNDVFDRTELPNPLQPDKVSSGLSHGVKGHSAGKRVTFSDVDDLEGDMLKLKMSERSPRQYCVNNSKASGFSSQTDALSFVSDGNITINRERNYLSPNQHHGVYSPMRGDASYDIFEPPHSSHSCRDPVSKFDLLTSDHQFDNFCNRTISSRVSHPTVSSSASSHNYHDSFRSERAQVSVTNSHTFKHSHYDPHRYDIDYNRSGSVNHYEREYFHQPFQHHAEPTLKQNVQVDPYYEERIFLKGDSNRNFVPQFTLQQQSRRKPEPWERGYYVEQPAHRFSTQPYADCEVTLTPGVRGFRMELATGRLMSNSLQSIDLIKIMDDTILVTFLPGDSFLATIAMLLIHFKLLHSILCKQIY